jgi:hypothetical protein
VLPVLTRFATRPSDKYTPAEASLVVKRCPLSTQLTTAVSPSLAAAPVVDTELMARFVSRWRQTGFLA